MKTNVALVGGGTAGHIMPNVAVIPYLKQTFDKVIYLGSPSSMEESICKELNIPFYPTETAKFHRKKIWKNASLPFHLIKGVATARKILKKEEISVVFSKGGYASVPTVLAAHGLGIPIACHESDRSLGLANRFTAKFADKVYTAFPGTYKKGTLMQTPIRDSIFSGSALTLFNDEKKPVVLFMGGSLGARAINEALSESFGALTEKYNILHIAGKTAVPMKTPSYVCVPFARNVEDYFATADAIVSRAGASTLGELTALGKKILAIPLPKGESRGDQEENAAYYLSKGAIRVLPQSELTPKSLLKAIDNTIRNGAPAPAYDRETPKKLSAELYKLATMSH